MLTIKIPPSSKILSIFGTLPLNYTALLHFAIPVCMYIAFSASLGVFPTKNQAAHVQIQIPRPTMAAKCQFHYEQAKKAASFLLEAKRWQRDGKMEPDTSLSAQFAISRRLTFCNRSAPKCTILGEHHDWVEAHGKPRTVEIDRFCRKLM